jgi:hypothetical protein
MLVDLVESETGFNIRKRNKKREVTYARALYCKLAREIMEEGERYSYNKIGKVIGKDHATVLHNVNTIFPFAMQEYKYKYLYNCIKVLIDEDYNDNDLEDRKNTIKDLQDAIKVRDEKIIQLKRDNLRFNVLVDGLTLEERNQLYEKIELTAKVIKAQRGAYAEAKA